MAVPGIDGLSEEIREHLSPNFPEDAKLVQKGLMLYRQGMVSGLSVSDAAITARVQDVVPCKVELNMNFLGLSECSCPIEGMCRHQMAVFFAAYAASGSVEDWVNEWREPFREKRSAAVMGLQTAKDLIKANGVLKPDYGRWVQTFESSFDSLVAAKKYTNPYVVDELFKIYLRRIRASAPIEQEWKLFYQLVGIVVSFTKLAALGESAGYSQEAVRRAYQHLFDDMLEDAHSLVRRIGIQTLPFDFDEFVVRLMDDAFGLLTVCNGLESERVDLYQLLWTGLFKKRDWREDEIQRILGGLEALKENQNPMPLKIAGVHLNLLLGDDEKVLALLEQGFKGEDDIVPYMLHWVDYLVGLKAWKRLGPLVELFGAKIKGYLDWLGGYQSCYGFVRTALRTVAPFYNETGRIDLFEKLLIRTLPYSFGEYEYILFERNEYERWGELNMFVGLSFYDLPKDRVKIVEKERPDVLLGMLHTAAQNEIDQKNRQSYRMAVRHLKKLRTLYKKLKRVDDWDYFLEVLMERTKRLRAFHEELYRGKLVELKEA